MQKNYYGGMANPRPRPPSKELKANRLARRVKQLMAEGWSEKEARKLALIQMKNRMRAGRVARA